MKSAIDWSCQDHSDPFDCPDALVKYSEDSGEYGLIIHDGGSSIVKIEYCPWCGLKMTPRKIMACEKCGFNSLNHAKQPNGNNLIDCFKHMLSFPNIATMRLWAARHCDEPEAEDERE